MLWLKSYCSATYPRGLIGEKKRVFTLKKHK